MGPSAAPAMTPYSAEAFLLALLREDERAAREALASGADPAAVAAICVRHGIAGYVAALWPGPGRGAILPPALREPLAAARRKIAMDNTLLYARARPILERLHARGIDTIVLKGPALIGRVYDDAGARLLSDLDLLVPAPRAAEAIETLQVLGLAEVLCDQRSARRLGYEAAGPGALPVEIHWDLSQRHRFQADLAGLWERSVPFELEGIPARRLGREDEFLYLALHHAAHYFGVTLKWVVDLRELLRRDPPDAGVLDRRASLWHGRAALGAAGLYLKKIYPALGVPQLPAPGPLRARLLEAFRSPSPIELVTPLRRGASRLALGLLFVDRARDMARLGAATLLGGDDHDHDPPAQAQRSPQT